MFYDSPVMPYILMAVLLSMPIGGAVGYWLAQRRSFVTSKDRMPNRAPEFTGMGHLILDSNGDIAFVNESVRTRFGTNALTPGTNVSQVNQLKPIRSLLMRCLNADFPHPQLISIRGEEVILIFDQDEQGRIAVYMFDGSGLNEAQRVRTEFVANAAHELRTPLATILGYAETLYGEQNGLGVDQRVAVEAIFRNSTRLRDIFEDILRLARVEAGADLMLKKRSHVLSVMQETLASVADLADSRGVDFVLQCPSDLYFLLNAEATQTMVSNLAKNAVNYTPTGGQVSVTCRIVGEQLCIVVKDNGIGIAPEFHARIFERFFRVDVGRSRSVGGTGLGLALVKHLCAAVGGKLELTSVEGKGTTFTLHI